MLISETTTFTMGSEIRCTDGVCGTLRRVVVDPVARSLTHLVVEPGHRERDGHLVPIGLVSSAGPEIELSCDLAEFETLEQAQELRFLPGARGQWGYQQQDLLSWPYYGSGIAGAGVGIGGTGGSRSALPRLTVRPRVMMNSAALDPGGVASTVGVAVAGYYEDRP